MCRVWGESAAEGIGEAESLSRSGGCSAVSGDLDCIHNAVCGGVRPEELASFKIGATDEMPGGVGIGHRGSFDLRKL